MYHPEAYKPIPGVCFNIVDMIRAAVVAHILVIGDFSSQRLRLTAGIQIKFAVLFCCRYVTSRSNGMAVVQQQRRDNVQQIALALDLDSHLTVRGQCGKRIFVFELPDSIRLGNTGNILGFCVYLGLEFIPHCLILGFAQRQGRIAVGVSRAKCYGIVKFVAVLLRLRERLGRIVPVCPAYVTAKLHLYRVRFLPNGVKGAAYGLAIACWQSIVIRYGRSGRPCNAAHRIIDSIERLTGGILRGGAPACKHFSVRRSKFTACNFVV